MQTAAEDHLVLVCTAAVSLTPGARQGGRDHRPAQAHDHDIEGCAVGLRSAAARHEPGAPGYREGGI